MELFTWDSKGKLRQVNITLTKVDTDAGDLYIIHRESGLYNGKMIAHTDIEICKGKVKRSTKEQAELQFNSEIKKYLDKGYIKGESIPGYGKPDFNINSQMPKSRTDQHGIQKPMLCKVIDFEDKKLLNKTWYASFKHDGVRCFIYKKDGIIKTASRGGQDYNIAATHICSDPSIVEIFKKYPDLILDGEIYKHGWTLNKISGLCRLETLSEEHKQLNFHCYDIANENLTFEERNAFLLKLKEAVFSDSKLIIVDQFKIDVKNDLDTLKKAIMDYHQTAITNGYEGLVIRDSSEKYKFNARDRRMQKIKLFTDAEFKIKDISEGLREEDMCFLMETKEGYEFKAKPIGTRKEKQYYRDNIENIKGKYGTVKFFGMTNTAHPVPNLPVFKCIRNEKDL